jgi:hypothetical protein
VKEYQEMVIICSALLNLRWGMTSKLAFGMTSGVGKQL